MKHSELEPLLEELSGGDDERAEAAAGQLAAAGPTVIPTLGTLLASQDPDKRWWAARVLAEISDPQALPLLLKAFEDPDRSVRQCAALALRQHPGAEAIPALAQALGDSDRLLAHLAADALIANGEAALPALLEVMQNGPQAARLEAVRALAAIGDTRAIPALFNALDEPSALIEFWAEQGLERMGVGMMFFKP